MSNVLVISGHPNLANSNTNALIIERLANHYGEQNIRLLDTLYPNYHIDIAAEQQALTAADIVVLQFPLYWYSMPALLKKWLDDVFAYNFAYGSEGDKLKGKKLVLSITVGGPDASYSPLGYNHFTIEQLLKPLEQTSYLTQMALQPPVVTHGMVYIPDVYNTLEDVLAKAEQHADKLITTIEQLAKQSI